MDSKPWYASRTIWANLVGLIAVLGTAFGLDLGLTPETQASTVAGILGAVNVVLRLRTTKPISKGDHP